MPNEIRFTMSGQLVPLEEVAKLFPMTPQNFERFVQSALADMQRDGLMDEQPAPPEDEDEVPYFGGCPHCGRTDGYNNIVRAHWFLCDEHRTRWCAGANLFSSWRDETEEDWERNRQCLENYTEVKPVYEWPGRKPAR